MTSYSRDDFSARSRIMTSIPSKLRALIDQIERASDHCSKLARDTTGIQWQNYEDGVLNWLSFYTAAQQELEDFPWGRESHSCRCPNTGPRSRCRKNLQDYIHGDFNLDDIALGGRELVVWVM